MSTQREERMEARSRSNYSKILAMVLFLTVDLGLNSVLDYDLYNQNPVNSATHLLLGLLGIQVAVQIFVFVILVTAIADTFLFRVGLLSLLLQKFRLVLLIQPLYLAMTLVMGSFRVRHFGNGDTLYQVWNNTNYIQLSTAQKVIAVFYYLLNVRATIKLGDPIYYNKHTWVALVRQCKDSNEAALNRRKTVT